MLKGRAFGQRTCFDQGAPNLRVSRRNAVFSRFNKPPVTARWLTRPLAGSENPAVIPSIQPSTAGAYEICRKRLARGGVRSQPSAARSGGLAVATTWTARGRSKSPTPPLECHTQHGSLNRRRRGRQFVEEQVPALGSLQPLRPGGWLQADAVVGGRPGVRRSRSAPEVSR